MIQAVSVELVFIPAQLIQMKQMKKDFAIIDLPRVFLHADCDAFVIMRFQGWLIELMVLVAPQFSQKYMATDRKGKSMCSSSYKRHYM